MADENVQNALKRLSANLLPKEFENNVAQIKQEAEGLLSDLNKLFTVLGRQFQNILDTPKTIEEMAAFYAVPCDLLITEETKGASLNYVGGKLHVSILPDNDFFDCSAELYFQNADGKWFLKKASSAPMSISFLTAEAEKELLQSERISFEVTEPGVG